MYGIDESCFERFKSANQLNKNKDYKYSYDATDFKEKDWCRSLQNTIIDIDGEEIQIINVHGIWNKYKIGDERTIMQSKFILSKIKNDIPCVVVEDFNLLPNTESINKMINLIKLYDISSTRPKFNDGLDIGNSVCDYVFVDDKIKVNSFKILDCNVSNHFPLILDFQI